MGIKVKGLQNFTKEGKPSPGVIVSSLVMTIAWVTTCNYDPIYTPKIGIQDEDGVDAAGTHHPDCRKICRNFQFVTPS